MIKCIYITYSIMSTLMLMNDFLNYLLFSKKKIHFFIITFNILCNWKQNKINVYKLQTKCKPIKKLLCSEEEK